MARAKATNIVVVKVQHLARIGRNDRAVDDHYLGWLLSWCPPAEYSREQQLDLTRYACARFALAGVSVGDGWQKAKVLVDSNSKLRRFLSRFACRVDEMEYGRIPLEVKHAFVKALLSKTGEINAKTINSNGEEVEIRSPYLKAKFVEEARSSNWFKALKKGKIEQQLKSELADTEAVAYIRTKQTGAAIDGLHKLEADKMCIESGLSNDAMQSPELVRALMRRMLLCIRKRDSADACI